MRLSKRFSTLLSRFIEEKPIEKLRRLSKEQPETWGAPWNFKGEPEPQSNLRYLPDRLFIENKVSAGTLLSSLYRQYEQFVQALATSDLNSVQDIVEPKLKANLETILRDLKTKGRRVEVTKDKAFPDQRPTLNFKDGVIVRGLNTQRDKNDILSNYHIFIDSLLGVSCFTHLDIQDPYAYVNQGRLEELFKLNSQSLIQVLVWVRSPWKLHVYEGDQEVSKYADDYNYSQECVFECMLEQPPWMTNENRSESYLEWIVKFKLGAWKVSGFNEVESPLATRTILS